MSPPPWAPKVPRRRKEMKAPRRWNGTYTGAEGAGIGAILLEKGKQSLRKGTLPIFTWAPPQGAFSPSRGAPPSRRVSQNVWRPMHPGGAPLISCSPFAIF